MAQFEVCGTRGDAVGPNLDPGRDNTRGGGRAVVSSGVIAMRPTCHPWVRGGIRDRKAADQAVPAVHADVVLGAEDRHRDLAGDLRLRFALACRTLAPRLIVQRPSPFIWTRFAWDHASGSEPPLIVVFRPE
jgi:hypothetical protein